MKGLVSNTARYISGLALVSIGLGLGFAQFILELQLPWTVGTWIGIVTLLLTAIGVALGLSAALPRLMEDFDNNEVDANGGNQANEES